MNLIMILKDKENQLHILVKHFKSQNKYYSSKILETKHFYNTIVTTKIFDNHQLDLDFILINTIDISLILNSPILAFSYLLLNHLKNNKLDKNIISILECLICVNSKYSLYYADIIKEGRFQIGEKEIAKNSFCSFQYAYWVLKDKFLFGESIISKNAYYSLVYAKHVLNGPFPLGELAIANDIFYSKEYTKDVLKKDFYLDDKLVCEYTEDLDKHLE